MELKYFLKTPYTSGEIVNTYLKVLKENIQYDAWTVDENLEVIKCIGVIQNNGSYNYHNNYDDSENELHVIINKSLHRKWFSLNKEDAIEVQKLNIIEWECIINSELLRIKHLCKEY